MSERAEGASMEAGCHLGLSGPDYCDPVIYELEKRRIFYRSWFCVGREEQLPEPGDFLTGDVADQSIVVVRARDGALHAFYNVCQHRGSRLCQEASGHVPRAFVCPYHAWSYGLDGRLLRTPGVREARGVARERRGLRAVAVDCWDGFVFVNLAEAPEPLLEQLAREAGDPLAFGRYRTGELRVAHRIVYEVRANWKIVHDNFNECLHCASVHPELTRIIPIYRSGQVMDPDRSDGGVCFGEGHYTFTFSGSSALPPLPGLSELDRRSYYGYSIFPNVLMNMVSTGLMVYVLYPQAPDRTTIVSEYLYRPETIADAGFDCSDMVKFLDLVSQQDWAVCERVQQGVTSRGFERGVYPAEDGILHEFAERYRSERGPVPDE